tara:strand:- start:308 stop:913 length:606 start_codon:yes stop_codon:yes gene_type:complete
MPTPNGNKIDQIEPGEIIEITQAIDGRNDNDGYYKVRIQNVVGYIERHDKLHTHDADSEDIVDIPKAMIITVFDEIHNGRIPTANALAKVLMMLAKDQAELEKNMDKMFADVWQLMLHTDQEDAGGDKKKFRELVNEHNGKTKEFFRALINKAFFPNVTGAERSAGVQRMMAVLDEATKMLNLGDDADEVTGSGVNQKQIL